jgi:NHL repeat.
MTNILSSNDNYICAEKGYAINVFSLDMKLIISIPIDKCQAHSIDNNNNIHIATNNKFYIYDLRGKLINSWNLADNFKKKTRCRKISFSKNEIFMVDAVFNCVYVFSYEEKLIRSWGKIGNKPGEFNKPQGIAVYNNVVFVSEIENHRIQVFTCQGKFMFTCYDTCTHELEDIIIKNDYMYVTDYCCYNVLKLKIIYSNQKEQSPEIGNSRIRSVLPLRERGSRSQPFT